MHRQVLSKSILATTLYAASVPLAYISIPATIAIFIAVPAMFFLPLFAHSASSTTD